MTGRHGYTSLFHGCVAVVVLIGFVVMAVPR